MNSTTAAISLVLVVVAIGAFLVYRQQEADAARFAYDHSLGGAIGNTIGGVGNIIGAAVGMAGSGSGGGSRQ